MWADNSQQAKVQGQHSNNKPALSHSCSCHTSTWHVPAGVAETSAPQITKDCHGLEHTLCTMGCMHFFTGSLSSPLTGSAQVSGPLLSSVGGVPAVAVWMRLQRNAHSLSGLEWT